MVSFSLIIFSGEILLSKQTTGEFFELEPFNYMLGPSIEIMIQVGARFPPCMRPVESMPADERYVCDNNDTLTTSSPGQSLLLLDPVVDLADPRLLNSSCSLSTICGMTSFHEDNIPDQTYRLVSPLFIHTGLIHLIINMAFLLLLGRQVERVVNCLRFSILFFGSGIFGHALGANFAPPTTPFLGCSSSLFGFIGFLYIDLVANWKRLEQPLRYLIQLLLGTAFSFIIGLLPG
ncbi:hypothetical protein BDF20DRAFT_819937 [Mycotypha africana]|uniref:uncharacterized protein n=1 Tax=Mycotypha africana TaxID=64632 RepID=UPI0022FFF39B|nr:uncharacterized protein BDF20DRAFT_819937 [Mycotypha africana]KAI8979502.1 hypothetical protein BDF20DRAFT_819937 [Mycotypha africana]